MKASHPSGPDLVPPKEKRDEEGWEPWEGREERIEGTEEIEGCEGRQQAGKQAVKRFATSTKHEGPSNTRPALRCPENSSPAARHPARHLRQDCVGVTAPYRRRWCGLT